MLLASGLSARWTPSSQQALRTAKELLSAGLLRASPTAKGCAYGPVRDTCPDSSVAAEGGHWTSWYILSHIVYILDYFYSVMSSQKMRTGRAQALSHCQGDGRPKGRATICKLLKPLGLGIGVSSQCLI